MTFGIVRDLFHDFLGQAIIWIIFTLIIGIGVGFIYVVFKLFGLRTEADTPSEMEQRGYHFLIAGLLLVCFIVGAGVYVIRWNRVRRSNVLSGESGSSQPPVTAPATTIGPLERMWTFRTSGPVQSLALIRDRGNSPLQILVLADRSRMSSSTRAIASYGWTAVEKKSGRSRHRFCTGRRAISTATGSRTCWW
jgi:hypothetical protein